MAKVGDTVWLRKPTAASDREHLYFIIAISNDGQTAVLVNMSDLENCYDKSCVVKPGEHPSVTKDSGIKYLEMCISPVVDLDRYTTTEPNKIGPPANELLIRKIQAGALRSDFTRKDYFGIIKDYLESLP